jgi:hypothetical protein
VYHPEGAKVAGKPVLEIKHKLSGERLEYQCTACLLQPPGRAILFYVTLQGWVNMYPSIRVPAGSFTFAYYWGERNYNVYHWLDPERATIGFYFNAACHTVIDNRGVEWEDLELDYWLDADGHAAFIDEEKVPLGLVNKVAQIKKDLVCLAPAVTAHIRGETTRLFPSVFSTFG